MKHFQIPKNVEIILDTIHEAGEEAYIVGGCVRDLLLGMKPNDWDITTSALPGKVKNLFDRTIDTGLDHGTVTVMIGSEGYEVTTYRIDGDYEDHRRPDKVVFTRSLKEDLLRRDFTINAMAYNPDQGIIDMYDGMRHLEDRIITCVGNPVDRFEEDALRMLRAIRFSAKLGFEIEKETYDAIILLKDLIGHVSAERIQVELTKTLVSPNPYRIKEIVETGLSTCIMPELDRIIGLGQNHPYHEFPVDEHTYRSLEAIEADRVLRWTMLLHDLGKGLTKTTDEEGIDHFKKHPHVSEKLAKDILKRLKFDNKSMDRICRLIRYHDHRFPATPKSIRKAVHTIGNDYFMDYLKVRRADVMAQALNKRQASLAHLEEVEAGYHEIMEANQCLDLGDLAVSGRDMIELGHKGRAIGEILNHLLNVVLEDPDMNHKDLLMDKARQWKK